jgi:hypothetical protein
MKRIKLFEDFSNQLLTKKQIGDLVERYRVWKNASLEESYLWINSLLENDFDESMTGFKNFPEKIKVYRIIYVKNKLNTDFIGFSWTIDENNLYSLDFLESIGLLDSSEIDRDDLDRYKRKFEKMKVITAEFRKDQVDFYFTILNLFRNPMEKEISVKSNPVSYDIKDYDMVKIK